MFEYQWDGSVRGAVELIDLLAAIEGVKANYTHKFSPDSADEDRARFADKPRVVVVNDRLETAAVFPDDTLRISEDLSLVVTPRQPS